MPRDELYLRDIVEAADRVATFVAGRDLEQFLSDEFLRSAVMYQLMIVGEAARSVDAALTTRYPLVPWQKVKGFRNIVAHAYFSMDWPDVWDTIREDVPILREQIAALLEVEFVEHTGGA